MKFLFLTHGLGEFAQGESFAKLAQQKGIYCFFATDQKKLMPVIKKSGFYVLYVPNSKQTRKLLEKKKISALFLCNSKSVREMIWKLKFNFTFPVASFDSNWLFSSKKESPFYVPSFLNRIYVVMPYQVFKKGLKEKGGNFKIESYFLKKIKCPGFIPSGKKFSLSQKRSFKKKLGLSPKDKLIFLYLGRGETRRSLLVPELIPKIIKALTSIKKKVDLKLFFVGEDKIPKKSWLIQKKWLKNESGFELALSSADLVIQHHGLSTLAKIIRAYVPAICFVPPLNSSLSKIERYEIKAFEKNNLCVAIPYSAPSYKIEKHILNLLFSPKRKKIIKAQRKIFQAGEKKAFLDIVKLIRDASKN